MNYISILNNNVKSILMDVINDTLIIVIRVQNIERMRFVYKIIVRHYKVLDTLRSKFALRNPPLLLDNKQLTIMPQR